MSLADKLVSIKRDFAKNYSGSAHIQEVIPCSDVPGIRPNDLTHLHDFALKNPIYHSHYGQDIDRVPCTVYEGDINEYWLNSIKHGLSCQPFYPTWITSAFVLACIAKDSGYTELVDIGSGDGRIAFCGNIAGLVSHSIEIDDVLVELQNTICASTNQDFNPICSDALEFDYSALDLKRPVFFIGGLAQMGGDILAAGIIDRINGMGNLSKDAGVVLAGTDTRRHLSGNAENGGWGSLIQGNNLKITGTVSLPTVWTFDQSQDTPYIFTEFRRP